MISLSWPAVFINTVSFPYSGLEKDVDAWPKDHERERIK